MQKNPKQDEQKSSSSNLSSTASFTSIRNRFEQSSQTGASSIPPRLPPKRISNASIAPPKEQDSKLELPKATTPKSDAHTEQLHSGSIKRLAQQFETKQNINASAAHQRTRSQPVSPVRPEHDHNTRGSIHSIATLKDRLLQQKLSFGPVPLHQLEINITESEILTSIHERARTTAKLARCRKKPCLRITESDSQLDIEHSYFKLFFEIKKKQLLLTLDSAMTAFLKHGPIKSIIEVLFKKEIAAIDLSHASFRDLIDSFKKIITIAMQYRMFFLAIEAHEKNHAVPLPESVKNINILSGMFNLVNVAHDRLDNETLVNIRNEVKKVYGKNFSDLPYAIPPDPASLSEAFLIFIKKVADLAKIDIHDRQLSSKLGFNDIIAGALTLEPNDQTVVDSKVINIFEALKVILVNNRYEPTPFERRNASLNALLLYKQLATNTPLDIPLNGTLALIIAYLLQKHHPREMPNAFNKHSKIYQRLSMVVELSAIIDEQPAPRPYSLREQIIIDIYKDFFINIPSSYLARRINAALQGYLDEYDGNSNLLNYLNHIMVNAATLYLKEKNPLDTKQRNRYSKPLETTTDNSSFYDIDSEPGDESHFKVTQQSDSVQSPMIKNLPQKMPKSEWISLTILPEQVSLEYQFVGNFGERIELAWLYLKELNKLAEHEKSIIQQLNLVVTNIESLEKQYADLVIQNKKRLSKNQDQQIQKKLIEIRKQLIATNQLPYKSSQQLLLTFLTKHGPGYLQSLAKETSANSIRSCLTRLLGNSAAEFNCAHIPSDILHFIDATHGGYKAVLASTAPEGFFSSEINNTQILSILLNRTNKEKKVYFVGPNRFLQTDDWLRQLYKLFERQLLTINYELRPEIIDALGLENIQLNLEKIGKESFISNLLASYCEFVGGYLMHQIELLNKDEQTRYLTLYAYTTNRIHQYALMKYPALLELSQINRMLFFIYDNSANQHLRQQTERLKIFIKEIDAKLYGAAYVEATEVANFFLAAFDSVNSWRFSSSSNNKYEVFLARLQDKLLDWLQANLEELSTPAYSKNTISIINDIHKAFYKHFSQEYRLYHGPVTQETAPINNEIIEQVDVKKIKKHYRKTSMYKGIMTFFDRKQAEDMTADNIDDLDLSLLSSKATNTSDRQSTLSGIHAKK